MCFKYGQNYDVAGLEGGLNVLRLTAQDQGVYAICSGVIDMYFSLAAEVSSRFGYLNDENLTRALGEDVSFTEFLATPVIALHKLANLVTRLSDALNRARNQDKFYEREVGEFQGTLARIGGYLRSLREEDSIEALRHNAEDTDVRDRQIPASFWHTLGDGKPTVRKGSTPFSGFQSKNPRNYRTLLIHDAGRNLGFFDVFENLGYVDVCGCGEQALNALATNSINGGSRYDLVILHTGIKMLLRDALAFSSHEKYVERTLKDSNFPPELTEEGKKYMKRAEEILKQKKPGIHDLGCGYDDHVRDSDILAAMIKSTHPSIHIVGTGGYPMIAWNTPPDVKQLRKKVYDYSIDLPVLSDEWSKIEKELRKLLERKEN